MRARVKRPSRAAIGNARLTDFAELREVVLYHVQVVARIPEAGRKHAAADHTLNPYVG